MTRVTVNLEDNILVGCCHFTNSPPKLAEAIENTLHAFITAMQAKGKMPMFSERVMAETLAQYDDEVSMQEDFLASIRDYLPSEENNIRAASEQAEKVIELAATPHVKRSYTVDESASTESPAQQEVFSLFDIERQSILLLAKQSPKDRFIERAINLKMKEEATTEDLIYIAAVEVCYTGLSQTQWGSDVAETAINKLIAAHVGTK